MRRILFTLLLTAGAAHAQVSLSANAPPLGFVTLPNDFHTIDFNVANGRTNRVDLAVASPATLLCYPADSQVDSQTCANALPVVGVRAGSATGGLFWTGPDGAKSLSSATSFAVHATSVDDRSQKADAVFLVAAPKTEVRVLPLYRQLYSGQKETVDCQVWGNADARCSFQVAGDGCTLGSVRDLAAEVTHLGMGTCYVTAISVAEPSQSAVSQIGFVAAAAPYAMTANETYPVPCEADPDRPYTVVDIGPSKQYRSLDAVPPPGDWTLYRIFNESMGPSSAAATTYHSNFQIKTSHVRICGVPNAQGRLPNIDCSSFSTSPPWMDDTGAAGSPSYSCLSARAQGYSSSALLTDLVIEGLHVYGTHAGDQFLSSSSGTGVRSAGAANLRFQNGWGFTVAGMEIEDGDNGVWALDNPGYGYGAITRDGLLEYNYLHGNGSSAGTDHAAYIQTEGAVIRYNRFGTMARSAQGFHLKIRSVQTKVDVNYFGDGGQRALDFVDLEAGACFIGHAAYLSCGFSPGDGPLTADQIAGNGSAFERDRISGNITNADGQWWLHYGADHDNGFSARHGRVWITYNTAPQVGDGITSQQIGNGFTNSYFQPFKIFKNNVQMIGFNRRSGDCNFAAFSDRSALVDFGRNLYTACTVDLSTPMHGGRFNDGLARLFANDSNQYAGAWEDPIDQHVLNLVPSNFPVTPARGLIAPAFAAPGEALLQALPLTGEDAYDLPRYSIDANGVLTPRSLYTDLGAVQTSAGQTAAPPEKPRGALGSRPGS